MNEAFVGRILGLLDELDAEHQPDWASDAARGAGKDPVGCLMCWPRDGSWPCTTRLIVTELREALATLSPGLPSAS